MSEFILEGTGVPVLTFKDGNSYELPEPNGDSKKNLRRYYFSKYVRDSFLSEGNVNIEVGVTYSFAVNLSWITLPKTALDRLFKAQNDNEVTVILNKDVPDIKYAMRISELDYEFFEGNINHPAGYSVTVRFVTIANISQVGYGQIVSSTGMGSSYGQQGSTPY